MDHINEMEDATELTLGLPGTKNNNNKRSLQLHTSTDHDSAEEQINTPPPSKYVSLIFMYYLRI